MPSRPRSRHHAFTLIELLVVVAIVALISSMITGAVLAVRESSRVQEATTRVDELQMAIESYLIEEPVPIDPEDGNDGSGYLVDSEVAGGPSLLRQLVHKRLFSYTHSRDLDRQGRL
ncbi:MAG: type II secretion system protein, partial [Planctomycetota bacterium]